MSPRLESSSMTTSISQQNDTASPSDKIGYPIKHNQQTADSYPSAVDSEPIKEEENQTGKDLLTNDVSKTRVIYKVEYRDERGRIIDIKTAGHPLEPRSRPDDDTVLEISSILTVEPRKNASEDSSSEDDTPSGKASTAESVYDSKPSEMSSKTLTIHSDKLANALRAVVYYSPSQSLTGRSLSFEEPYKVLFHHFAELGAYRHLHPSQHSNDYRNQCNKDIDLLLEVLRREKPEITEERRRYDRSPPICTFDLLWLLFKPGEACYRISETGQISAYIVRAVTGGTSKGRLAPYRIYMWQLNFDGYHVGREVVKVEITPFVGEKETRLLECVPCKYYKGDPSESTNESTLRHGLIKRGKKFWKMARDRPYVEYSGISLVYPYEIIRSRVMIDPKTFYSSPTYLYDIDRDKQNMDIVKPHLIGLDPPRARYAYEETPEAREMKTMRLDGDIAIFTGCRCNNCRETHSKKRRPPHGRFTAYAHLVSSKDDPPNEDEFFFLCGYKVVAFVLREGKWKLLNVEHAEEVMGRSNAFDHLVLEPEIKDVVKSLSRSYSRWKQSGQRSINTDLIKGKGQGQIFLLHGPPGVGKTATAETIADYTQRPLLALTCGDLGTDADGIEKKLRQYLEWGELWGAVVLLDEADIYLEKRNLTDVHRNSMVSVFLRALEYYKGLLFLTTNRVNTFDEAFTSRIHVALHYKKLQDSERREIWTNSFERLKSDRVKVAKAAQKYTCESREVLDLEWNGREIRNAFQTAISLAEFDAEEEGEDLITVRKEHFEKVVRLSAHFQKYLATMHRGMSESEIAKRRGLRNDSYGEVPKKGKGKQILFRNKRNEDEEEEDEEEDRRMRRTGGRYSNHKNAKNIEPEEGSEEDAPRTSSKGKKAVRYEEDEESEEYPPKRSTKGKKPPRSEEDEEFDERRATKPTKGKKAITSEDEEEEEKRPKAKK